MRFLARDLLHALAVRGRIVEGPSQRVPRLRIEPRLVEPEDLNVARRDVAELPLAAAAVAERQRVRLLPRGVVREDIVAVGSPATIDEATLADRFADSRIPQHSIESDGLAVAQIDHRPRGVVLVVIVGTLDGQS